MKAVLATVYRLCLLIPYAILTVWLTLGLAGGGHGTYIPPAVFYSWGLIPWLMSPAELGWEGLFAIPGVYLLAFFLLTTVLRFVAALLSLRVAAGIYLGVVCLHLAGVILACFLVQRSGAGHTLLGYAVGVPVATVYFLLDWAIWRPRPAAPQAK